MNIRFKIFCILAACLTVIYICLILQNKLPYFHDTGQFLQMQYNFYNEVVQSQSLPLWFPFVSHGLPATYSFDITLSMCWPLIYLLGMLFKSMNYLYVFYCSMWVEELFLLMGIILLSSIYYRLNKTTLFVSVCVSGTAIWYLQIYWDFHIYYHIPILLYCIHKAAQTKSFKYIAAALIFSSLFLIGSTPSIAIYNAFLVSIYLLFMVCFRGSKYLKSSIVGLISRKNILIALALLFVLFMSAVILKYHSQEVLWMGDNRGLQKTNSFENFLHYGQTQGPKNPEEFFAPGATVSINKYIEIFTRYRQAFDIKSYAGFLLFPFLLIALLYARSRISFVVLGVTLVLFLFSNGTFVSWLFYYFFPFGKYFRPVGGVASSVKLFAILYAGFGFEEFLKQLYSGKRLLIAAVAAYILLLLGFLIFKPPLVSNINLWHSSQIDRVILLVLIYGVLIVTVITLCFGLLRKISPARLVNILFCLLLIDVFSYKYSLLVSRMPSVSKKTHDLFLPLKYEFPYNRLLFAYAGQNRRIKPFLLDVPLSRSYKLPLNTIESFFFTDSFVSVFGTDFKAKPITEYFSASSHIPELFYSSLAFISQSKRAMRQDTPELQDPLIGCPWSTKELLSFIPPGIIDANKVFLKYSGVSYPKLIVFSRLNIAKDWQTIGRIFNTSGFSGDMLFSTDNDTAGKIKDIPASLVKRQDNIFKNDYEIVTSCQILAEKFSFNTLKLKLSINDYSQDRYFLYYADAYHPCWAAYVNGKKTPVIRSNIGYKAISVPGGPSEVLFKFGDNIYFLSVGCTLFLMVLALGMFMRILFKEIILYGSSEGGFEA